MEIYLDTADLSAIAIAAQNNFMPISGITTNPSIIRAAGVSDYEAFGRELVERFPALPVSLEVIADDFKEMRRQAVKIASWGENVFVKIPITNTRGESSADMIQDLTEQEVQVNVTAILTAKQVRAIERRLNPKIRSIVSIFAGRIADTGVNPVLTVVDAVATMRSRPLCKVLWASTREAWNIRQAEHAGAHIITMPPAIYHRACRMWGDDLTDLSIETVRMFASDSAAAGFTL